MCALVCACISECLCVCSLAWVGGCVGPSGFVRAITSTFMHRFQNNFAQLLSFRSKSAIWNICLGKLKGKATLEGQNDDRIVINWACQGHNFYIHAWIRAWQIHCLAAWDKLKFELGK